MTSKETSTSWMVLSASFMLMFMETGTVKSLGVLLPHIREQFATQTWVIGFAISMMPGFGVVVCLFSGFCSKVFGVRATIVVCALLGSFGLLIAPIATTVETISTAFFMTGFVTGTTPVAAGALPAYFDKHMKVAFTVLYCGMSLGMIVMPILSQLLLDLYGWRGAILLLSGMSLNSVVCGALIKPIQVEYKALATVNNDSTDENYKSKCNVGQYFDTSLLSNLSFLAILSIDVGTGYCTVGWLIYIVPHALDLGFAPYKASAVAMAGGLANLLGNCLYPFLASCLSNKTLLYISICFISISFAMDPFASSFPSYIGVTLCAVGFGVGTGLKSNTIYAIFNDTIDEEQLVNALGLDFAVYGFMSVISGFMCGWLFDHSGSYVISFLVLSGVSIVTFVPQCIMDVRRLWTFQT